MKVILLVDINNVKWRCSNLTFFKKSVQYVQNPCYNVAKRRRCGMNGMEMLIGKEYFSENKISTKEDARSMRQEYQIMRSMVKDKKFDKIVNENIIKDKKIKSGVPIIKGTRISTKDVMKMVIDGYKIEEIKNEFPSITGEKQLLAAVVYEIRKKNYILFTISYK